MSYRYEAICSQIEDGVRRQPTGSRIPSFRSLMARFECSQATVERALQRLELRGTIARERDSGLLVSAAPVKPRARRDGSLAVIVSALSNRSFGLILEGVADVAREQGVHAELRSYGDNLPEDEIDLAPDVRGLIVIVNSLTVDDGSVAAFMQRLRPGLKSVIVNCEVPGLRCPFVGFDDFGAGVQAGEILRARGVTRPAVIGCSLARVQQARVSGLVSRLGKPEIVIDFPRPDRFDREALKRLVSRGADGLFIARPDIALQTLCVLESLGDGVAQKLPIVTIAEEGDDGSYPFPVVSIVKPSREVGREAARALAAEESVVKRLPYHVLVPSS